MAPYSTRYFSKVDRSVFKESLQFRTRLIEYKFVSRSIAELEDEEYPTDQESGRHWLEALVEEVMHQVWKKDNIKPNDRVAMTFYGGDLTYPVSLPMFPYQSPKHQRARIMEEISKIQQSKRDWLLGASLEINVSIVSSLKAEGRPMSKNNRMTESQFATALERGIVIEARPTTSDLNLTFDTKTIVTSYARLHQLPSILPDHEDDWMIYLSQWCTLHPHVNVLVLHQPKGESTPHEIKWKSSSSSQDHALVLWYHEGRGRLYEVRSHELLYGRHNPICLKCGLVFRSNNAHQCAEEATQHSFKAGQKRAHFQCTENERARKKSRLHDDESKNCLGRALYNALVEWGWESRGEKELHDWFIEMNMSDTWDVPSELDTVRQWCDVINEEYGCEDNDEPPFEFIVYDETLRHIMAQYGEGIKPLFLNYCQHHFTWIRSMPGWVGRVYFCHTCMKGYNNKEQHKCTKSCSRCGGDTPHRRAKYLSHDLSCDDCGGSFASQTCYNTHKEKRSKGKLLYSQCERRYQCSRCHVMVDRLVSRKSKDPQHPLEYRLGANHECFEFDCPTCNDKKVIRGEHQCFVKGCDDIEEKEHDNDVTQRKMRLAFFDIETQCLEDHHIVNKVVVLLVCEKCQEHIEEYATRGCTGTCGRRRLWTFNTAAAFMQWLMGPQHLKWTEYTFLAHNLKGYDAYPILEQCILMNIKPKCVYQGAKVLTMTIENITFKDSLCFIPMALRAFPKTFGTSGGRKGFFPHFFNTKANANYVGPYPELHYYGYDEMGDDGARAELKEWWDSRQDKTMHFQKELEDYCIQDVLVMMRGCLKYRELYVTLFGVAPFTQCVTLASTCLKVFTKNYLTSKTLGVVPPRGYRHQDIYSAEALEWLYSLSLPHLQSAMSLEGEAIILGAKVDGYDAGNNTIYQYHGCFWHGCEICFKDTHAHNNYLGTSMVALFHKTRLRTRALREAGYHVVEMWSHAWDVERERHPEPPRSVTRHMPLIPRTALCGGRTNAIQMYAYCKDQTRPLPTTPVDVKLQSCTEGVYRIRYIDVVSLYPTVMKQEKFPIGHPIILTANTLPPLPECVSKIEDGTWFGLVKCDVVPPRGLYFPVLPVILNHRLMFGLCRTCMVEDFPGECEHTEDERMLLDGVWTTFEIQKALEKGYRLEDVHEVWYYDETSDQLFAEYINQNLKIKMEASGWPARCVTEEDKDEYIEEVFQREGFHMNKSKVILNPGLRSVAKLNLNSLWGKFGQGTGKTQTEYVTTPERYFELIYSDNILVTNVILLGDKMAQVTYTELKESVAPLPYGNVVVASCVTSHARLRLYAMLDQLKGRVVYHDTDSIIYITPKEGDDEIVTGSCLGQWEDECKDPTQDWLEEFVSLGPKSYAYRTHKGKTAVKCKGITLIPSVSDKIHLESMKHLLVEENQEETVSYPRKIVRNTLHKQLLTVSMDKRVRLVYTKRQRQDIYTRPFGY